MAVVRVPSNYWGEVKPGSTASAAESDVAYEAKQRLRELFYSTVERYGRVAVENAEEKLDRLKRQRNRRFNADDDARRIAQEGIAKPTPWGLYALIAGAAVGGYFLFKRL